MMRYSSLTSQVSCLSSLHRPPTTERCSPAFPRYDRFAKGMTAAHGALVSGLVFSGTVCETVTVRSLVSPLVAVLCRLVISLVQTKSKKKSGWIFSCFELFVRPLCSLCLSLFFQHKGTKVFHRGHKGKLTSSITTFWTISSSDESLVNLVNWYLH